MDYHRGLGVIRDARTYKLYDTCSTIAELRGGVPWWVAQSTIRGLSDCGGTSIAVQLNYFIACSTTWNTMTSLTQSMKSTFALHYVFLPCINKAIEDFRNAWNHHGVRTERGMTPNQPFTMGMLQLKHSGLTAMNFFNIVDESYGVEEDGLVPEDDEGVEVPRNTLQLSEQQLSELQEAIDPLADSEDYGISIYTTTLRYLDKL